MIRMQEKITRLEQESQCRNLLDTRKDSSETQKLGGT